MVARVMRPSRVVPIFGFGVPLLAFLACDCIGTSWGASGTSGDGGGSVAVTYRGVDLLSGTPRLATEGSFSAADPSFRSLLHAAASVSTSVQVLALVAVVAMGAGMLTVVVGRARRRAVAAALAALVAIVALGGVAALGSGQLTQHRDAFVDRAANDTIPEARNPGYLETTQEQGDDNIGLVLSLTIVAIVGGSRITRIRRA
jgi:hypothetical protein